MFAQPTFTPDAVLKDPAISAQFFDEVACNALTEAASYVSRVLTAPDPMLGRSGAVCPFVGAALIENMITLTVLPVRTADVDSLRQAALSAKAEFDSMSTSTAKAESLRAIVILLPYLDVPDALRIIETVQKALKPDMVASGLMIGEFYPGCTLPGLHNAMFHPADTSLAFLAIRRMTAGDLPFLIENASYVQHYLARFGDDGRQRLRRLHAARTQRVPPQLQAAVVAQATRPAGFEQCPNHAHQ